MNVLKNITKFIWEEFLAFLAWVAPTLWNMCASNKAEKEIEVTGYYQTEGGHTFTHYSDGTTEAGPPSLKGPF